MQSLTRVSLRGLGWENEGNSGPMPSLPPSPDGVAAPAGGSIFTNGSGASAPGGLCLTGSGLIASVLTSTTLDGPPTPAQHAQPAQHGPPTPNGTGPGRPGPVVVQPSGADGAVHLDDVELTA